MTNKTQETAAQMFDLLTLELTGIVDKFVGHPQADEALGLIVKLKANGFQSTTAYEVLRFCEDHKAK